MDESAVSSAVSSAPVTEAVGEALNQTVEAVVDEVVPPTLIERLDAFSQTWYGNLLTTAFFIVVVVLLTIFLGRAINRFFRHRFEKMLAEGNPGATAFSYLRYLALGGLYFGAFAVIVSNIPLLASGMNKLFAAGGVLAVVAGLASQQALGSMVSGAMILFFKPFVIGDVINMVSEGVTGTVEEITLRHTILRTVENKRVIIPNDSMSSAIIENANHTESKVCLLLDLGISYESDITHAMHIMREEIQHHPDFYDNRTEEDKQKNAPPVVVRVQELGESAVLLRAQLWAKDSGVAFAMRSDLLQSIKERCDQEGVEIAYPHLVVVSDRTE